MSKVRINVSGDLGQYGDCQLNCPCGESYVVPKLNKNKEYELYHLGDLVPEDTLPPTKDSLVTLCKELQQDKSFYEVWQANIAMVLHDKGNLNIHFANKLSKELIDTVSKMIMDC